MNTITGYVKYFIRKRTCWVDNPNKESNIKRINIGEYYITRLHFDNELDESMFLLDYEYLEKFDDTEHAIVCLNGLNKKLADYIYDCLYKPLE